MLAGGIPRKAIDDYLYLRPLEPIFHAFDLLKTSVLCYADSKGRMHFPESMDTVSAGLTVSITLFLTLVEKPLPYGCG